jgi:hypothetical protein
MVKTFICSCCHRKVSANPRTKNQRFCGNAPCQRERKRRWQQAKMATDPDYRANQQDAYHAWCDQNPDYWRQRRHQHSPTDPQPVAQTPPEPIVKMDALKGFSTFVSGIYVLTPADTVARKMDALTVKIIPISAL